MNPILNGKKLRVLLMCLCIVGIAAASVLSWTVGNMNNSSIPPNNAGTQTALGHLAAPQHAYNIINSGASTYSGANMSVPAGGNASSAAAGSTPGYAPPSLPATQPDPLYPTDPTPKCPYYKYPGGIQPMNACYPCEGYQTTDGIRYPCGCGGTEILCDSPL